jgi:hypothetical protein
MSHLVLAETAQQGDRTTDYSRLGCSVQSSTNTESRCGRRKSALQGVQTEFPLVTNLAIRISLPIGAMVAVEDAELIPASKMISARASFKNRVEGITKHTIPRDMIHGTETARAEESRKLRC